MHQKKILTEAERDAITAKYQRRILELGTAVFGPPDEVIEEREPNAKAQELQRRIMDASIQFLEAAPADYVGTAPHRKPGDLNRTAERLRGEEVDLPDGFDREEEAALLEEHAEFARAEIDFGHEMDAVALEALTGLLPILETVRKFVIDILHVVKEWAQEDPEGPGAEYYRELNRAWRQGAGRSRGSESGSAGATR